MAENIMNDDMKSILSRNGIDYSLLPREVQNLLSTLNDEREKRIQMEKEVLFYKASLESLPNPIFIKNDELKFVFFNKAYRNFFNLKENENIGKKVQELTYLNEEDRKRYGSEDQHLLKTLSLTQYDTVFTRQDNSSIDALYWSTGFSDDNLNIKGVIGEIVDISKEKLLERKLKQNMTTLKILLRNAKDEANTDELTKVYNRKIFCQGVPLVVKETLECGEKISVIVIDIDNFKEINDTYGHSVGDNVLCNLATTMKIIYRQKDVVIRYGGDEFIVVMPYSDLQNAITAAKRLIDKIKDFCTLPDGKSPTISIGATEWKMDEDFTTVFKRADEALYEAKVTGKNKVIGH